MANIGCSNSIWGCRCYYEPRTDRSCYTFSENQFVQFSKPPLEKRNFGQPLLATERRVLTTAPSLQGSSGLWVVDEDESATEQAIAAHSVEQTCCIERERDFYLEKLQRLDELVRGLRKDLHGKEKVTYEAESHENGMTGGVQRRPKRRKRKDRTLATWVLDEVEKALLE